MVTNIFVNLPVKDIQRTREFFTKIGFTFNEQFSDEASAGLVLGEGHYVMFLEHEKFNSFVKKEIADTSKVIESITSLQVDTREEVDELMENVIAAGGKEQREPFDYGFMYGRAFYDPDGHTWEIFYMDISKMPKKEDSE